VTSWFQRLKTGLARSTARIVDGIGAVLGRRRVDAAMLAELEEALIAADLGPTVAARLVAALKQRIFEGEVDPAMIRRILADDVAAILAPVALPLDVARGDTKPHVTLVVGVNGSGKTTTIGKLAERLTRDGHKVVVAAGDTFRAAAVQQLEIWAKRAGATCVKLEAGGDPAALAYQALEQARRGGADALLIDTAGRLHNKADLMAELGKMIRVLKKLDPTAPHRTLLVLDATTGQNAIAQVDVFRNLVEVDGLIVTKLDGSARGGVLVAIAERFKLPVVAVGVGETVDDLQSFDPRQFADALLALEPSHTRSTT
jgi:fused signal recognition particle receptor